MPIYEYICSECGHELEALQKMSEAPLSECPACARPALKKRISAAGFRLTGSGWYETDFKNKPKPKADTGDDKQAKSDKDGDDKTASSDKDGGDKPAGSKTSGGASAAKEAAA